jgi:tetratricopeptide (TPR) repeat protein
MLMAAAPSSGRAESPSWSGLESYFRASALRDEGKLPEAIREFRRALASDSLSGELQFELARTYLAAGNADSASLWAESACRLDSTSAESFFVAGMSMALLERREEASARLERAHRLDPRHEPSLVNLMMIYQDLGRPEKALALVWPDIPVGLDGPAMRMRRAALLALTGNMRAAREDAASVLRDDPGFPHAESLFHHLIEFSGDSADAVPLMEDLLARQPGLDGVRLHLARMLIESDRWREAIPHLARLLSAHPQEERYALQLGVLRLREGSMDQADSLLLSASALDPKDPDPLRWLALSALERRDPEAALERSRRLLALDPHAPGSRTLMAECLHLAGRDEEALAIADSVLAADPRREDAGMLSARIHRERKEYGEAISRLGDIVDASPQDREARFQLAATLEMAGEVDSSLAMFDQLLAEDPGDARAWNHSGYMCIERGIRLTEALDRVERALKLDPDNPAFLDSEGWGWFKMGRPKRAIVPLRRAAELAPHEPVILRHLGQVQLELGLTKEAQESFRNAARLSSEDPEAPSTHEGREGSRGAAGPHPSK